MNAIVGKRRRRIVPAVVVLGGVALAAAAQAAETPQFAPMYGEAYRPLFHFTARANWINDPNGLVFYKGEYHLFFQHDPTTLAGSGFKTWGHATSVDLVHWRQMNDALVPDEGGSIWSGSAVVDWHNTAGFQVGTEPPLVAIYTSAGGFLPASASRPFTQSIAYSNDRGRSWYKYLGNPVVPHIEGGNRDPKVVWHEPTKRWIMALYLDGDRFALLASRGLKKWSRLDEVRVPGSSECPDFFEIPIAGASEGSRWVFWTASNAYLLGSFDGQKFSPEGEPQRCDFGDYYAAQTFSDVPAVDGRRLQIAWMRGGEYPGMPFNQQMSIPSTLTLRRFEEGLQLCREPVKELEKLRGEQQNWTRQADSGAPAVATDSEAVELNATLKADSAGIVTFKLRGVPLVYDVATRRLALGDVHAVLPEGLAEVDLRVFVDRTAVEVFAAGGRVALAKSVSPKTDAPIVAVTDDGGLVERLSWWPLESIWNAAR